MGHAKTDPDKRAAIALESADTAASHLRAAELLLAHEHWPRAQALAVHAHEEAGKACLRLYGGQPGDLLVPPDAGRGPADPSWANLVRIRKAAVQPGNLAGVVRRRLVTSAGAEAALFRDLGEEQPGARDAADKSHEHRPDQDIQSRVHSEDQDDARS